MPDTAEAEGNIYEEPPRLPGVTEPKPKNQCGVCEETFTTRTALRLHRVQSGHRGARGPAPGSPQSGGRSGSESSSSERRPQVRRARIKLDKFGTSLASGGSWMAARTGHLPLSRVLTLEAAALGPAFEDAIKNSPADRLLQPVARLMDGGSKFGALAGLPAATEMFCRNPNPMTQAAFVGALDLALPLVIASMKDARKRQERLEADLSELAEAFGKEQGEKVTIEEVAGWILGPPEPPPPEPAREEAMAG